MRSAVVLLALSLLGIQSFVCAMVSLHGRTTLRPFARGVSSSLHEAPERRPPNPHKLLSPKQLQDKVDTLLEWLDTKKNVLTLTGAGLSTESGIPDYRGHNGSYHRGHKPMIHDQFMSSHQQRQRYWGRGMVGWRDFDTRQPNAGHFALGMFHFVNHVHHCLGLAFSLYPISRLGAPWKDWCHV